MLAITVCHSSSGASSCHTYLNIITPSDPPPLSYHPSLSAVITPLLLLLLSALLPLIFIPFSRLHPSISAPSLKSSQLHPLPPHLLPPPPTRHLLIRGAAQEKWISSLPAFPPFRTLYGCCAETVLSRHPSPLAGQRSHRRDPPPLDKTHTHTHRLVSRFSAGYYSRCGKKKEVRKAGRRRR